MEPVNNIRNIGGKPAHGKPHPGYVDVGKRSHDRKHTKRHPYDDRVPVSRVGLLLDVDA